MPTADDLNLEHAKGVSVEGLVYQYMDSKDGSSDESLIQAYRSGRFLKYNPISHANWVQTSNGKIISHQLAVLERDHKDITYSRWNDNSPPFAMTDEAMKILNPQDGRQKRRAASVADTKYTFESPEYEEVDVMPRPRNRRRASSPRYRSVINVNVNVNGGGVEDNDEEERLVPPLPAASDHDILYCPITKAVMKDPVVAEDGFTYDKAAIEQHLRGNNNRSPMTNQQMGPNLVPNRAVKSHIEASRVR